MYHTLFIHENYLLKCKSDHVRFLLKTPQWLPVALSQRLPMAGMPSSSFRPSASVLWPRGPLPDPGTSQALSQPHTHVALCLEPSSLLPWHWFILTPDVASLVRPPQSLSLSAPCLLPSHYLASLVACLLSVSSPWNGSFTRCRPGHLGRCRGLGKDALMSAWLNGRCRAVCRGRDLP